MDKIYTPQETAGQMKETQETKKFLKTLSTTALTLLIVAALALLAASRWFPFLQVYSKSMEPTLQSGEVVLCVNTMKFERGQLISYYYNNRIQIKRVIGLPGETIEILEDGTVWIDGTPLEEPWISEHVPDVGDLEYPITVPQNTYFVLGDNRENAIDSRYSAVGCVGQEQIIGRLLLRLWPISRLEVLNE